MKTSVSRISRGALFLWFLSTSTFVSFSVAGAEANSTSQSCRPAHPTVDPNQTYICNRYYFYNQNGYCAKDLGNASVYATYKKQQFEENQLQSFDKRRKFMEEMYKTFKVRKSCVVVWNDVYCHWVLPLCDQTSSVLQYVSLCRETCELLMNTCDKELDMARRFNLLASESTFSSIFRLMNCSDFPSRNGGDIPECYYRRSLNDETDKLPGFDCYYGNGIGYLGKINVTRSGLACQSWSSQCPHRHRRSPAEDPELVNASNSCRNPGGQAPNGPWCYTANSSMRWEYCPVDKCPPPAPSRAPNIVGAFATGPTRIYLEWSPVPLPFVHGEPRGFRVLHSKVGDLQSTKNTTGPEVTRYEFDELQPSVNYSLAVLEFNENGDGPMSPPTFVMTMPKNSVSVRFQLKLTRERFSPELLERKTTTYNTLATKVQGQISSVFPYEGSQGYMIFQIKIVRFTAGSVNVEFDVTAEFNESKSSHKLVKSALVGKIMHAVSTGKLGTLPVTSALVKGAPPGPRNLKSSHVDTTSATISWSPPTYHEVYNITNFTVQYKKAASRKSYFDAEIVDASQRQVTIKELGSATEYEVRVVSHNAYGKEASEPITVNTEAKLNISLILAIVLPLIFLIIIMVAVSVLCWKWREKRRKLEVAFELEKAKRSALSDDTYSSSADVFGMLGIEGSREWWEIPREDLTIESELGSGAFGVVKKAILEISKETRGKEEQQGGEKKENEAGAVTFFECAVKMSKANPTERELRDLCNEINIMATVGDHPNIVGLIGACTLDGPLWLVVKLAENGCLLDYIKQHRSVAEYEGIRDQVPSYENAPKSTGTQALSELEKLKFALEIAKGMEHLGLQKGMLPVRWMAIESLEDYTCTTKSDVWSYGVLLWEIESGGLMPWAGMTGTEIVEKLRQGYRLDRPSQCSEQLYRIMRECWNPEPKQRPTFSSLVSKVEELFLTKAGYEKVMPVEQNPGFEHPYETIAENEREKDTTASQSQVNLAYTANSVPELKEKRAQQTSAERPYDPVDIRVFMDGAAIEEENPEGIINTGYQN